MGLNSVHVAMLSTRAGHLVPLNAPDAFSSDEESIKSEGCATVEAVPGLAGRCWDALRTRLNVKDNPTFERNVELGLRATFIMTFCVRPFILDGSTLGIFHPLTEHGLITSFVVVYVIYQMAPTLGAVIQGCVSALRGMAAAVLDIWLLKLAFGTGVTDTSPAYVYWLGLANGAIFVFVLLLLRFDMSFKTFGLKMFVKHMMDFLNPASEHRIRLPWQEGFPKEDDAVCLWLELFVGTLVISLAVLLPYPLLARHKAHEIAQTLTTRVPLLLKTFVEHYSVHYDDDRSHRALKQLDSLRTQLQGFITLAYWECFGLGVHERSRCALQQLGKTVGRCYDHVYSIWGAARREAHETKHSQLSTALMQRVHAPLEHCCDEIQALMRACLDASVDDELDDQEVAHLLEKMQEVDAAKAAVAEELHKALDELVGKAPDLAARSKLCLEELSAPLVLCHNIAGICVLVRQYAKTTVDVRNAHMKFPKVIEPSFFLSLFENIFEHHNMSFTFRSCLSIYLSFLIGLVGYNGMIPKYNADIASTASVLLVTYTGSAMIKSSNRAQGVMLGLVLGLLLKQMFHGCAWYKQLCLLLSFAMWSGMSVFARYQFPAVSDIAKFMGAFGDQQMIKNGSEDPNLRVCERGHPDQAKSYLRIETTVLAIVILFMVDFLFAHERASTTADLNLQASLKTLKEAVVHLCDPHSPIQGNYSEKVLASLTGATAMGKEAEQEPRWWRIPWPTEVWNESIRRLGQLRYALASLERNLAGNKAVHKEARNLLANPEFRGMLEANLDELAEDAKFFAHETTDKFVPKCPKLFAEGRLQEQKVIEKLVVDFSQAPFMSHTADHLEDDPLCVASSVVSAIRNAFYSMNRMHHSIIFH